jgi:putative aldouronate transport system permease protein
MSDPKWYLVFLIVSDVWQNVGFASILYLAAIVSADVSAYEAAKIDGANRWAVMWYITLPVLIPTVVLQLILQLAKVLNGNFGQIRQTYSPSVYEYGDIIDSYIYRTGLKSGGDYGIASALDFFKSVIGFVLVLTTNYVSNKISGEGIF